MNYRAHWSSYHCGDDLTKMLRPMLSQWCDMQEDILEFIRVCLYFLSIAEKDKIECLFDQPLTI